MPSGKFARKIHLLLAAGCCLLLIVCLHSQTAPQAAPPDNSDASQTEAPPPPPPIATRAPGLWEVTSTITWQRSPIPAIGNPAANAEPRVTRYCVTPQQVNVYAEPQPRPIGDQCRVTNIWKKANGVEAEWSCGGSMAGKGTAETTWANRGYAAGRVHFVGSIRTGSVWTPVEYTIESQSVFKSPDCGNVKPLAASGK